MIAVRPPEYWPRLEYAALLDQADVFVVADTFRYSRQSFQNRTPLRTPDGRQWISIPLRGRQHGYPIGEVEIHGKRRWLRKHWRALHYNYRTTPFFDFYEDRLRPVFEDEWDRLADLTMRSIELMRTLLGIDTPLIRASELDGAPATMEAVLEVLGRSDLVVPRATATVDLPLATHVLTFEELERRQNFAGFVPGLSALDLLFNYGPDALRMIRAQTRLVDPPADHRMNQPSRHAARI